MSLKERLEVLEHRLDSLESTVVHGAESDLEVAMRVLNDHDMQEEAAKLEAIIQKALTCR